ncbi:tetratricopeptide repeat protein [Mesorhizobium sp. BAC0120]|uniref:tetratricopeptide repeat protein n=1 Tax=Mesorhizobium sp. BAC0120 TaxID=3090670 RepID=UPI00298C3AB2|nr:tetratricopeptide repeat protein [Mesorhizobium sp. BAC0120]MDW6023143.1 tetratricopeptide repeat protein [Mesorhizobium sp. BAC0120]
MLRFAGFELDQQRAELRGPDGGVIRLRPKPFAMLHVFAANAGRVVSKQELMEAVWPKVHVGEDSLFQCIREIRAALGDDERRLIKVVSGRGYLFEAEVSDGSAVPAEPVPLLERGEAGTATEFEIATGPAKRRLIPFRLQGRAAVAAVAGLCAVVGFALAAPILAPGLIFTREPPTIAVMPIADVSGDSQGSAMAAGVTDRLLDGLAEIDNIRVVAPPSKAMAVSEPASIPSAHSDFVLQGELQKDQRSWTFQARIVRAGTGEVQSVATVSVDVSEPDVRLQQARLAAGAGDQLARRLNALLEAGTNSAVSDEASSAGSVKIVIEQAMASINQTSRERFATAQSMLENALAAQPDNVDLQVALTGLQTRGIQMAWYSPPESAAAESNGKSLMARALQARPRSIPVLEAYCRFLTATNNFTESLVACASALSFDPWNGSALYQLGLTQVQLGRFEDALTTFRRADRFDTPAVSRWTWLLGTGWTYLLMGRAEEALPWLERSIAITPASGRSHMLLAAAYQRLGRPDEAKAALAKAMELRPGSTALNLPPPTRNTSPIFLEATQRLIRTMIEVGLPAG